MSWLKEQKATIDKDNKAARERQKAETNRVTMWNNSKVARAGRWARILETDLAGKHCRVLPGEAHTPGPFHVKHEAACTYLYAGDTKLLEIRCTWREGIEYSGDSAGPSGEYYDDDMMTFYVPYQKYGKLQKRNKEGHTHHGPLYERELAAFLLQLVE